ncbi:MAG TPA: hypothetical protein VKV69_00300 [Actinomycetota bacterium]|nr:hypothetical protein [Actinomycetota bacterium]
MASILLVEDAPDLGLYEAGLLEQHGHTVLRCSGGPTPFAACPMMRDGSCPVADAADLIIFSCGVYAPLRHRTYRGVHLLRAYREHPAYGRLPMLVVSVGAPDDLLGTGPIEMVAKFADPKQIVGAVERLLARAMSSSGV